MIHIITIPITSSTIAYNTASNNNFKIDELCTLINDFEINNCDHVEYISTDPNNSYFVIKHEDSVICHQLLDSLITQCLQIGIEIPEYHVTFTF